MPESKAIVSSKHARIHSTGTDRCPSGPLESEAIEPAPAFAGRKTESKRMGLG